MLQERGRILVAQARFFRQVADDLTLGHTCSHESSFEYRIGKYFTGRILAQAPVENSKFRAFFEYFLCNVPKTASSARVCVIAHSLQPLKSGSPCSPIEIPNHGLLTDS